MSPLAPESAESRSIPVTPGALSRAGTVTHVRENAPRDATGVEDRVLPDMGNEPRAADFSRALVVTAGSVIGREHARVGRGNQDGVALHRNGELVVAAVTDGCSSGRYSEVGARLGAAHLAGWVPQLWRRLGGAASAPAELAREATDALLAYLYTVSGGLKPGGPDELSQVVADYLLFGFLCAVVDEERAVVFGIGDGVYSVNGASTVLDPGPENAPDYLAYRLLGIRGRRIQARVHCCVPTAELSSLVIGTDGLVDLLARAAEPLKDGAPQGGLEQFEKGALYLKNPVQVQKRLTVIGDLNRHLSDDTTLALIRREEAAP